MTTETDTEKLAQETVVVLAGGKYEVRHTNGTNLRALRYGERYRDVRGDNLVLALVQRIEELEAHERAHLASVPDGWVMVPRVPTSAMQDAGGHANSEWLNDNAPLGEKRYGGPVMKSVWSAMLAAAPQLPAKESE